MSENELFIQVCKETGLYEVLDKVNGRIPYDDLVQVCQMLFEAGYTAGQIAGTKESAARLVKMLEERTGS